MMPKTEPELIAARGKAFNLTQSFGISSPKEIVVEEIAMCRGVLVMDGALEGAEARLVRVAERGIIRVKTGMPEDGRRRFAIAHELGHWELHRNESQWQFCSESDIQGYSGSAPEIEANTFASELLMPTYLFRPRCEEVTPDLQLIKRLAEEFNVTLTAAAVRFVEESKSTCMVVFSKDDKVSWWKRSDLCNNLGLWIDKGWSCQPESMAWHCLRDEVVPPDGITIEPSVWFGESCADRIGGIQEQSIRLGHYPTVLTLLWIN